MELLQKEIFLCRLVLFSGLVSLPVGGTEKSSKKFGEFSAGTFILTQQSLLEAPYRYAGILRDVLDRVWMLQNFLWS